MTSDQCLNMVLNRFQVAIDYHEALKLIDDKCKVETDQRKVIAYIVASDVIKKEFEVYIELGIKEYEAYKNQSNLNGVENDKEGITKEVGEISR